MSLEAVRPQTIGSGNLYHSSKLRKAEHVHRTSDSTKNFHTSITITLGIASHGSRKRWHE